MRSDEIPSRYYYPWVRVDANTCTIKDTWRQDDDRFISRAGQVTADEKKKKNEKRSQPVTEKASVGRERKKRRRQKHGEKCGVRDEPWVDQSLFSFLFFSLCKVRILYLDYRCVLRSAVQRTQQGLRMLGSDWFVRELLLYSVCTLREAL